MSDDPFRPDRSIVVVEDDFLVRELAVCELEDVGFHVIEFGSADAALTYLSHHAADTAVVFTDVQMPGRLSGLDLATIVARMWPGLPVLITSGGTVVDGAALPSTARFMPKPWRGAEVVRCIEGLAAWSGGPRLASAAP